MNLSQLYYFRTLTQVKSYKKAAAELFISEPTLSVAIKKLESELGCKLFTRAGNQLRLTPYGEIVLERTRELDDSFKAMLAFVKYMKSNGAGAFSGNAFIPYFLFPDDVSNLHIQG